MSVRKSKALRMYRDGVVNVEQCYVDSRQHFHFRKGIFELCRERKPSATSCWSSRTEQVSHAVTTQRAEFLELTQWPVAAQVK